MQKNMLTQKQLDKLDGIGELCNLELFMPPSKVAKHPFFIVDDDSLILDSLITYLAKGKFNYAITRAEDKQYISIKG